MPARNPGLDVVGVTIFTKATNAPRPIEGLAETNVALSTGDESQMVLRLPVDAEVARTDLRPALPIVLRSDSW